MKSYKKMYNSTVKPLINNFMHKNADIVYYIKPYVKTIDRFVVVNDIENAKSYSDALYDKICMEDYLSDGGIRNKNTELYDSLIVALKQLNKCN